MSELNKKETMNGFRQSGPEHSGMSVTSGFRKIPRTVNEGFMTKTPQDWVKSAKEDCGIGPYWRIHDKIYNLTDFVDIHPGGAFWLKTTQGMDITEAFESAHLSNLPEEILQQYFVKNASFPRFSPFTFKTDGFYMTLKRRAKEALQGVKNGPTTEMMLIQDSLFLIFLSLLICGTIISSYTVLILAGITLALSTICAHNFFHQKDNWRMYLFDFSLHSSHDWRITHAMSHHLFPNTIQDYEIYAIEPVVLFFPIPGKNFIQKYLSYSPLNPLVPFALVIDYCRRGICILRGVRSLDYPFLIQPLLIVSMAIISKSFGTAITSWLVLQIFCTMAFAWIGWASGHHTHYAYVEGDSANTDRDWGLHQVVVIAERRAPMDNLFLAVVSFGNHTLHHLFPTLDHSKLHLLKEPFLKTCEEFGVDFPLYSMWDIFTSMFYRFYSNEPNDNAIQIKFKNCRTKNGLHSSSNGVTH